MKFLCLLILLFCEARAALDERAMVIVVSEPGTVTYEQEFRRQAKAWQDLAAKAKMDVSTIGLEKISPEGARPAVEKAITALPKDGGDLWLVWIGHGSFDGRTANFNLRGPDIDSTAVRDLLKPFTRRLVVLNLFSASNPFVTALSGKNRVIISSTRSGGERNFTRFGEKFADALTADDADLDLDGSLSLLEAAFRAAAGTRAFYEDAQRVVQEHAVIDDNGDGRGTPVENFKGLRAEAIGKSVSPDGEIAREIHFLTSSGDSLPAQAKQDRAKLELAIDALRKRKAELPEKEYYDQLEKLMLEMAGVYGFKRKKE
ncbi:MAG: hypothetical protein V4819_14215 [Verrucomicrobiota bacterium]